MYISILSSNKRSQQLVLYTYHTHINTISVMHHIMSIDNTQSQTLAEYFSNELFCEQGIRNLQMLVKCIQSMFDFAYIFNHADFRKAIENNPKQYVPFSIIFEQQAFKGHLKKMDLPHLPIEEYSYMSFLLYDAIKKLSNKLWAYPGGVRRIKKVDKNITPIYMQHFPIKQKCKLFENLIYSKCNIIRIDYDRKYYNWAIVYTDNPMLLLQLNGFKWKSLYSEEVDDIQDLRVYSCDEFNTMQGNFQTNFDWRFTKIYPNKAESKYPCFSEYQTDPSQSNKFYSSANKDSNDEDIQQYLQQ